MAVRTYPTGKDAEAAEKRQLMEAGSGNVGFRLTGKASWLEAKMKQRGAAVVPDKPGKDLNKELADMLEAQGNPGGHSGIVGLSSRGHPAVL